MNVEDCLPLLVGQFVGHGVPGIAGIVDDDIELAETVDSRLHELFRKAGRGDIAGDGYGPAAARQDGIRCFCGHACVKVVDYDAGALLCKLQGGAGPDAPTRSCYDYGLVVEHGQWSVVRESIN